MHATKTNEASRFFEVVEWSISVFQSHAREVQLYLTTGGSVATTEPHIDAVYYVIRDCGVPCADISIMME